MLKRVSFNPYFYSGIGKNFAATNHTDLDAGFTFGGN